MKISEMIKKALDKKGFKNLKDASQVMGISSELLRVTINKGHIPKDNKLTIIAKKLNLDMSTLVLAAHREKSWTRSRVFFLHLHKPRSTGANVNIPYPKNRPLILIKS